MNVGLRFHDAAAAPFEERAAAIGRQGFGCAHLALYYAFPDFAGDASLTPGFAAHINKTFASNGLDLAVLGCYMNLLHPDPGTLSNIQAAYRAYLRFASWLNVGVVGTETGCPNAEYRFTPECRTDAAFETFVRNFAPVVEDAERFGVVIGVEPVHAHSVYDAGRARRLLDVIASPNVRIIFDPINLLNAENASEHRAIFSEFLDKAGDEIAVLHLKDFVSDDGGFKSVPFGAGQADYKEIAEFVKARKPRIFATLEDTTPATSESARLRAEGLFNA